MKDTELREVVERALEFEPSIDTADIGVAVEDGVVTLTGHVSNYLQKITAETGRRRRRSQAESTKQTYRVPRSESSPSQPSLVHARVY